MARSAGNAEWTAWQSRIVAWAKREPFPHTIVGKAEGEEDVRHVLGSHKRAFADMGSALAYVSRVEAFDEKGNLLRALELDPTDVELARETEPREAQRVHAKDQRMIIAVDVPRLVTNISEALGSAVKVALTEQARMISPALRAHEQLISLLLSLLNSMARNVAPTEATAAAPSSPIEAALLRMVGGQLLTPAAAAPAPAAPGAPPAAPTNGHANGAPVDLSQLMTLLQTLGGPVAEGSEQPADESEGDE